MTTAHDGLAEQIRRDLGQLASAMEALVGLDARLESRVNARAPLIAAQLLCGDDKLAAQTVIDLMCVLFPGNVEPPTIWWGTPLGRAVARSVGHPTAEVVSYSVAGAMLGVTKTTIGNAVTAGRLVAGDTGGVTAASVREQLLRQDLLVGQSERMVADPSPRARRGRPRRKDADAG